MTKKGIRTEGGSVGLLDQLELFVTLPGDIPTHDEQEMMERPFFSLAKSKRLKPIDYISPDGEVWVKVLPHQDYGMATIWDADVLIWAASVLAEMQKRRANEIPRTLNFQPFDLLRAIARFAVERDH